MSDKGYDTVEGDTLHKTVAEIQGPTRNGTEPAIQSQCDARKHQYVAVYPAM